MAVCPSCQSLQPDGAVFCDNCGAKLSVPQVTPGVSSGTAVMAPTPTVVASVCPQCGSQTNPSSPFCDNCGASLTGGAPPVPGPQPVMQPPAAAPAAGMMTCTNCGAQLQPGSAFCDMCGAPVGASAPAAPPVQPQYQTPTPQPQYQQPQYQQPVDQPLYPQPTPFQAQQQPFGSGPAYPPMGGRLVVQGSGAQIAFPPGKTEIIVGREDAASNNFPDIDMNDHGGDEGGVSRRHARISVKGGQFYLEDLGSVNFTFINRQKLAQNQPQLINNGDEVQFGRVKLNFYL